jgi:class 3 adenylate cyclase
VGGLIIHAVAYLSVNAVLVFAWVVTTGSPDELEDLTADPALAGDLEFWPAFVILPWGVALVIHATAVLVRLSPARRRRRRRIYAERRREWERLGLPAPPSGPVPPVPPHRRRRPTPPTRRWTVVMFTDIARSTPLTETMGDEAWAKVLSNYRQVVREHLDAHGGREVGTQGDGFLCRFDQPDAAVDAAVELQRTLAERRTEGTFLPDIRIGIHAGEAIDDDQDLVGNTVNLAARVMAMAEPGEILVTEPVADHLAPEKSVDDRGLHELKGFSRPRHLLAVAWS